MFVAAIVERCARAGTAQCGALAQQGRSPQAGHVHHGRCVAFADANRAQPLHCCAVKELL